MHSISTGDLRVIHIFEKAVPMTLHYPCNTMAHGFARRQFLGTLAAGAGAMVGGLGAFTSPAMAWMSGNLRASSDTMTGSRESMMAATGKN